MEKNWFTLEKHCFLVKGARRAAIYDLVNGNVYSVNENAVELLQKCENGNCLKGVTKKTDLSINEILKYLRQLQKLKLGRFVTKKEKTAKKILPKLRNHQLSFIWLEIAEKCNLRCLHCYNESDENIATKDKLTLEDWVRVLKEARKLGCESCQFIGGEPFLYQDNLFYLISFAKRIGYKFIEIFTNATLLNEEILKRLVRLKVNLAISLYADNPGIHDRITQIKGSFEKTAKAIKNAKKLNIPLRVAVIIMKQNQNSAKETSANFAQQRRTKVC